MARSIKKGPFVDEKLMEKVKKGGGASWASFHRRQNSIATAARYKKSLKPNRSQ